MDNYFEESWIYHNSLCIDPECDLLEYTTTKRVFDSFYALELWLTSTHNNPQQIEKIKEDYESSFR